MIEIGLFLIVVVGAGALIMLAAFFTERLEREDERHPEAQDDPRLIQHEDDRL